LGVAVMGSIGASIYRHSTAHALAGSHLPVAVSAKALDSIGSALGAASTLAPGAAESVSAAAKHAFIRGLDISSVVGFGVAVGGGLLAWRFVPAGMRSGASASASAGSAPPVDAVALALAAEVDA
jgi:MFS transporter, DHA2 family, multidrug resistance protein